MLVASAPLQQDEHSAGWQKRVTLNIILFVSICKGFFANGGETDFKNKGGPRAAFMYTNLSVGIRICRIVWIGMPLSLKLMAKLAIKYCFCYRNCH
jgi:hypothetical protein